LHAHLLLGTHFSLGPADGRFSLERGPPVAQKEPLFACVYLQVFSQYREQGVLLWRGFTIQQMAHQVREPRALSPASAKSTSAI
jgi:hypothetical protein